MSGPAIDLPEVEGEACVHALAPFATCRACADVCPTGAWLLDDEGLALDTARCDGCGLCVPVCPRAAIDLKRTVTVLHDPSGQGTAWVACERSGTREAPRLPCVHAIGVRELGHLAEDRVRRVHILTGDCATCHRNGRVADLFAALDDHGRLRASSGLAPVTGRRLDQAAFDRSLARAREDHERIDRGRRRLFAAFVTHEAERGGGAEDVAPLALWQPSIDVGRCVACDACARHCPDSALIKREGDHPAYLVAPDRCSGCGLCVDICDQGAVRLARLQPAKVAEVRLDTGRCKACGVRYHSIAGAETGGSGYCRICSRTNHHKNLFQVFGDE